MHSDALDGIRSAKIRRAFYIAEKAAEKKLNAEIEALEKRFHKQSKTFAQKVLLYLAEEAQRRHAREAKLSRLTKMFEARSDAAESQLFAGSFAKSKSEAADKGSQGRASFRDENKKQKLDYGSTLASSEASYSSFDREENRTPLGFESSHRARALSMGVLQETSEPGKRRLSAPEVVITPVAKRSISSYSPQSSREEEKDLSPPRLTPQTSVSEFEGSGPLASASHSYESLSQRPHREKVSSRIGKSTFRTYSRTSPYLLRRMASHESSSERKRPSKHDASLPCEEIPNPEQDHRYDH